MKSLKRAAPSYVLVFLFVACLWLIFAIMGTAMFSEKMFHCYKQKEDLGVLSEVSCSASNGTFHSVPINFDSVANSYLALLQVVRRNFIEINMNCPLVEITFYIIIFIFFSGNTARVDKFCN